MFVNANYTRHISKPQELIISKSNIVQFLQMAVLLLFVSHDAFSYINAGASIIVAYYGLLIMLLTSICVLQAPNQHSVMRTTYRWWGIGAMVFVCLYLLRVLYDLYVVNVPFLLVSNRNTIPFLFICIAIMPLLMLPFMDFKLVDWSLFTKLCYLLFSGMGLYSVYLNISGQLIGSILSDGRMMGNANMDTIGFGHLGVIIILTSIAIVHDKNFVWKLAGICTLILGTGIIFGAGSRGPMIALVVCMLVLLYAKGYRMLAILFIPILLMAFYLMFPLLNDFFVGQGNYAIERIYDSVFRADEMKDVTSYRDMLYKEMFSAYMESPITGIGFLLHDGQYVHNVIFESFMAVGLLGGILFLGLITYALYAAITIIRQNECFVFVALLYIQQLVYGLFSRSLSILPVFWFSMYLVIGIYFTNVPPKFKYVRA